VLGVSARVRGRSGTPPDTAGNQAIGCLYFLCFLDSLIFEEVST
jgi:hypothetical protein